ncbi:piwi-like protein 1 [Magallana gigas]|uniref:Piwi-like protein 2 n=2 Tax=Magallana gigas TaxID=29159 RepID=A0A8W8M833_MAGGI|nr:piwi-like protein 1 [Crassostrea gigas]|eukprot:XP_019926523.1 PREDICTED: piwi-like protein 1 isoform X1 [Crassostrea gigas]
MATGFGRGGRGAALLQALSQPVRKPGEQNEPAASGDAPAPAPAPAPAVSPAAISVGRGSLGRGAFLQGVLQGATTSNVARGQPTGAAQPARSVPVSGGRGVANLQALLQTVGRGGGITGPTVPPPMPQVTPQISQSTATTPKETPAPSVVTQSGAPSQGSSEPPSNRLSRMALDPSPVVHKSGTSGKQISLSGNYIRINCRNSGVYQYHVHFSPSIDSKNMRFKLVNNVRDVIGFTKAFDGFILYLPHRLPEQETVLHSKRPTDGVDVTITIRLTKVITPEQCVALYNIIFRRIMNILEMVQVGRYYYNPRTPSTVPQHRLEVWPGYITSVSQNEGGLMLLVDASHRVLRTETVLQLMKTTVQKNPSGFQDECTRSLVGTIVLTRYNNKTYRIDDILWAKTPQHTFKTSSGSELSFVDYYSNAYHKEISDLEQPLLLHRPKKKQLPGGKVPEKSEAICLIPEFCYLTGLTDELRQDFRVMKDLASHTRVTPEQRVATMRKFINAVNGNPEAKKELDNWGLSFADNTIDIDGRLAPQEKIIFGGNFTCMAGPQADWGRDATRNKVLTAVDLRNWTVLFSKRDAGKASEFINMMQTCCRQMGIQCNKPTCCELHDDRVDTLSRSLRDNINPSVQCMVVICPTSRDDKYNAIKKICCVEMPVPSQVIIAKTIARPDKLRSVTQKIALQINCKLGGELWGLDIPMSNLMVVGIDVYHDASRNKRSIAGFVASTNKMCSRWYSKTVLQMPGQELIDGLKLCLTSSIRKYHEVNHVFPEKIVVFRDGVGDGDLGYIDHEVQQLQQCFGNFGGEYSPKLSVVIVQKRINARIFLKNQRNFDNPPPGTIVDHTITRRDKFDFFIVSQHVRQGTVSPTHYICVHDSIGMKADHLQRLSYKMTHLYYNWPGTVRVPAPCQYAHKLAYLVGQNIHKEPSAELSDRLFFL